MAMKRVVVFMGTRPEAIKLAPVVAALRAQTDIACTVVATGQHREMFAQVASQFRFMVDMNLEVMTTDQTLAGLTASLLLAIDRTLAATVPAFALVQGDTTTVLAAALAASTAGCRSVTSRPGYAPATSGHRSRRRRTDAWQLPSFLFHFTPTAGARLALLAEGVPDGSIEVTGNTVIDALHMELRTQREDRHASDAIDQRLRALIAADWKSVPFVLVTGHRREHFGKGLEQICRAVATLADRLPSHRFIYPVHLNPNVSTSVQRLLSNRPNVCLLPPLDYGAFVALLPQSRLVLTDSGGVQEEAPSLGKPVLVMRDTTERPEGVEAGTAILTGPSESSIVWHAERLLGDAHIRGDGVRKEPVR